MFYPGPSGPAFVKQYFQAGLGDSIPLYSVYTFDSISLPLFQDLGIEAVLGSEMTQFWAPDLDNRQNQRFVSDFRSRYGALPIVLRCPKLRFDFFSSSPQLKRLTAIWTTWMACGQLSERQISHPSEALSIWVQITFRFRTSMRGR